MNTDQNYFGRSFFSGLLRIERLALCGLCFAVLAVAGFHVKFYFPDLGVAAFVWRHYVGVLVPALIIAWLVVLLAKRPHMRLFDYIALSFRQIFAFLLVLFLHFNFKLWAQLINPRRFDDVYQSWDLSFSFIVGLLNSASLLSHQFIPDVMNSYHELFVAMFALSYLAHSLTGQWRQLEAVLYATSIVLLVGGACYAIAPALGPLIYGFGPGVTADAQRAMWEHHRAFILSGGAVYDGSRFVAALAAMPSLHVANACVFTYFAWRFVRVLALPFTILTLYFCSDAVALRWHYFVDIPAGILLAFMAVKVADDAKARSGAWYAMSLTKVASWGEYSRIARVASGVIGVIVVCVLLGVSREKPLTMIAHALGTVDRRPYTNSLEAFHESVSRGFRWFEVDLVETSDGEVVACHTLDPLIGEFGLNSRIGDITYEQFKSNKLFGQYTPLDLREILDLVEGAPELKLIIDVKNAKNVTQSDDLSHSTEAYRRIQKKIWSELRQRSEDTIERVYPQIYEPADADFLRAETEYRHWIFTTYRFRASDDVINAEVAKDPQIAAVAFESKRFNESVAQKVKSQGRQVLVFVSNDEALAAGQVLDGADGFYTDFLPADFEPYPDTLFGR